MLISGHFLTDEFQFQTQFHLSIPFGRMLSHVTFFLLSFFYLSLLYSFLFFTTLLALQLLELPHMQYAYNKIKLKLESFD